jgi:hypothetical protein
MLHELYLLVYQLRDMLPPLKWETAFLLFNKFLDMIS